MKERPQDKGERTVKRKRLLFSVVIILLLSLFLSGCALGHSAWWKEEVLLHDGQTIIVDRTEKDDPAGLAEPFKGPPRAEETIHFTIPGTKKQVAWKSDFGRGLQDNLTLLLLDFQQGTPYIATKPRFCHAYNKWGRPNPPYVFFKYDGKTWQRIKLEEFPAELTEANVVVGGPKPKNQTGVLSIAQIKEENRYLEPHLKKIMRQPVKSAQTMDCEEMIYYKGWWISPDSFMKEYIDKTTRVPK